MNRLEKFNKYIDNVLSGGNIFGLKEKYYVDNDNWIQLLILNNGYKFVGIYVIYNDYFYKVNIDYSDIIDEPKLLMNIVNCIKNLTLYKADWREQQINSILED